MHPPHEADFSAFICMRAAGSDTHGSVDSLWPF